jgi:hypothetical protein
MKQIYLTTCLLAMYYSPMVMATRMVRFIFNDGIPPTPNNGCSESDDEFIDPIFNITSLLERRDRQLSTEIATSTHPQDDRVLRNYPAKCKDNCALLVPGTCRASGCQGYPGDRRRLSLLGGLLGGDAVEEITCDAQMTLMHTAIDLLVQNNVLSLPCQSFVEKSKRKSECYDDVVYGEILSFTVFTSTVTTTSHWSNPPKPTVTKLQENTPNGYITCSSVPINIELVLNPCVNVVVFTLSNANNTFPTMSRTDSQHPMILLEATSRFRSSKPASPYATTRHLPPGIYTLTATPDNFAYKEKMLEFHVIAC